jgi:hypothetical protein
MELRKKIQKPSHNDGEMARKLNQAAPCEPSSVPSRPTVFAMAAISVELMMAAF